MVVVPLLACWPWGSGGGAATRGPGCLLAGPLFYFCALHLVFASSMRYRIPAEVPAMGLAAVGPANWPADQGRRSA